MIQLLLMAKVKHPFVAMVVLLFCTNTFANDSIPDTLFKEHVKESDAYLLYSYTDVSYTKLWSSYRRFTSVESKLVVNNRQGVEKYAFLNLNKTFTDLLETIQIKTLKADGTIVELDSALVFKHQPTEVNVEQINYPIPGVEPGDTIEISYTFSERLQEHELGNFVYLHNELSSINTEFSISAPPELSIRYKLYNDLPEPFILASDTLIYCLFKKEYTYGVLENQYTCSPCELPYVYYSIFDEAGKERTWKDIYNIGFNIVTQPMMINNKNSSQYGKWKRRVLREASDSTKYHKLELLLNDIAGNFSIEEGINDELVMSSGYFIKRMRFDPLSIRRLYRQILEDLEIDYWAVFARSKRKGTIDPFFIRNQEFDHIFFAYENEQGSLNILYPHDVSYKYQPGEIPTSLYNTEAVIAKPYRERGIKNKDKYIRMDLNLAEADSVMTDIIKLPGMNAALNSMRQTYYCNVDVKEQKSSFRSVLYLSGGLSTDIRGFFGLLNQNKEASDFYEALSEYEGDEIALKIDTITSVELKNYRPFVYKINAEGTVDGGILFINDSIVSITLDDLIQHMQIESDADSLDLNYYLDYSFTDMSIIIVMFPCDIEFMSTENFRQEIQNDYGKYTINVDILNNNQLSIHSTYSIIRDIIPKNDYSQLKELNDFVKGINNKRFLIKLKDI